jgi:hypothetical protein
MELSPARAHGGAEDDTMVALRACVRPAMLGLALALSSLPALAAPPTAGSTYTFYDPVFRGTVFCDTLDEIWRIATADEPDDMYANYRVTTNDADEPICMAIAPTGVVLEVTPIGVMERQGGRFNAWAIETEIGGVRAFALYLERFAYVSA